MPKTIGLPDCISVTQKPYAAPKLFEPATRTPLPTFRDPAARRSSSSSITLLLQI